MEEIGQSIKKYLIGGEREGFGNRNPLKKACGNGGLEALVNVLATSVM